MKTLGTEIRYQGRLMKQVKRDGRVAMYKIQEPYGYEVIVIRERPDHDAFGKHFPAAESYPSSEEWGTYGWSYKTEDLAGAEKRFALLLLKYGRNAAPEPDITDLRASEGHDSGQ